MKFDRLRDRVTYLLAEAQILVLGVITTTTLVLAMILWIYQPTIPGIPPIMVGWMASALLFGPAVFGFFVWLIKKLRTRNMVAVYHVNAVSDELEKYYVEPEVWADKSINGPNPYPINGGAGWAVQELEWLEDVGELRVKGVWLSECQDTKLLTKKSHMRAIYEKLTTSHIALSIMRDSTNELGGDIQRTLINAMAEARERGTLMDENAVKDVFESFESDVSNLGSDDLPTLEPDETINEDGTGGLEQAEPMGLEDAQMWADEIGPQAPADD